MNIIVLAVVVSVVFLGITIAIARSRFGAGGVGWFSVVSFFVSLCLNSPVLIVQSLLTFVLALVCTSFRSPPKVIILESVVAAAIGFGYAALQGYSEQRNIQALQEQFPLESVAGRLAYEARTTITSSPLPLSSHVEQRLSETEKPKTPTLRPRWLMFLHESKSNEFERALGFGNSRMIPINSQTIKERVVLPDAEPLQFPSKQEDAPDGTPDPLADRPRPDDADLLSMHTSDQNDFLHAERIGYVKDRDHVAGFVPHRCTSQPNPVAAFQLVRLELVSLLKHESPVAYVSDHLPQMDELRDAPTRPLDDFERRALDQLRSDEDLVIDDAPNRIRMVGSLRAGKDCLECHSVRRGELLGAFSYELLGGRDERRVEPGA